MKINLERQRLGSRDSQEFYFDTPGSDGYLEESGGEYRENLEVKGLVEKSGKHYRAHGQVKTALELQCSRCLESFYYPVVAQFQLNLVESKYQAEYFRDEDVVFFSSDEVEIQPYVEGLIFSEIPLTPLCSPNCKGICQQCGINRNMAQCQCLYENTDPRWDKLKNLKAGKEVT
ncbi:YceD family protein [Syntrophomonas curvata]